MGGMRRFLGHENEFIYNLKCVRFNVVGLISISVSYRIVSYRMAAYRIVWHRIVSYRIVSYRTYVRGRTHT